MHKNDFFPFIFFSYHSFSLSYLELQIIFPCRDIGPATATLEPRPRYWTRDRDFGPATISQTLVSPSPVLSGCLGIKTETYYIDGKKYSLTFVGIYGLTIELARKRQVCKARRVV